MDQGEKFEAKSGETPADLLRHALRRERRAENRCVDGFSVVSSFYQGQIISSRPNNFGRHAQETRKLSLEGSDGADPEIRGVPTLHSI